MSEKTWDAFVFRFEEFDWIVTWFRDNFKLPLSAEHDGFYEIIVIIEFLLSNGLVFNYFKFFVAKLMCVEFWIEEILRLILFDIQLICIIKSKWFPSRGSTELEIICTTTCNFNRFLHFSRNPTFLHFESTHRLNLK